jgi:hypothetical protein
MPQQSGGSKEQEGKRRKQVRRQRKDGKKARELEEHAARMGFIDTSNDDDTLLEDLEAELANDPELAAEVYALERDFESLAMGGDVPTIDEHYDGESDEANGEDEGIEDLQNDEQSKAL